LSRTPIALGCLSFLLHLACGDGPRDPQAGTGGAGGAAQDGGGGATGETCGATPSVQDCINGCVTGHVLSARVCQDGAWVCPIGTNPSSDCAGTGDCPLGGGGQCTDGATAVVYYKQCSDGTWSCPPGTHPLDSDAGTLDASSDTATPVMCAGDPPSCVGGTLGGVCADVSWFAACTGTTWTCPPGTILFSLCRCFAPLAPHCVCSDAGPVCTPDAGTG
jgi:hypothetical protein